ncbi:MAG: di-trans,poly-cis-decaprenylcistransferase [Kiritimatiellae bacterium]|jgi:undecaprenyl diphosphate synthase|nr:di-trans,poly-cis-decaprenylcistransferase [Kiritimatiellia bacterium]
MEHLAVIMDGNGRWAEKRHLPRLMGHRAGAEALDRCLHFCKAAGIRYLTVYAFSTENWKRSAEEVGGLMKLLSTYIHTKEKELIANGIRFRVIGRRTDLSEKLRGEIAALEEKTKDGAFTLVVALSYGGRDEIVRAAAKWARDAAADGAPLTEAEFARFLDTADIPDPDLIIRTSGEQRTSNFLLWQSAYAEYYFTETLWPDFDQAAFDKALAAYAGRERRMGGRLK